MGPFLKALLDEAATRRKNQENQEFIVHFKSQIVCSKKSW